MTCFSSLCLNFVESFGAQQKELSISEMMCGSSSLAQSRLVGGGMGDTLLDLWATGTLFFVPPGHSAHIYSLSPPRACTASLVPGNLKHENPGSGLSSMSFVATPLRP